MTKDVTITGPVLLVLNAIGPARDGICGADIMLTSGLSSGTLYPLLKRLEDAGWIDGEWEDGDPADMKRPRRRLYTMTDEGRSKMKEMAAALLNNAR